MGAGAVEAIRANILQIANFKSNLEYSITNICNQRTVVAWQTNQLIAVSGENYNNDPRVAQLQAFDNYLDLQQKSLETQQKAAATKLEALEKLLENNISKVYKLNLSA